MPNPAKSTAALLVVSYGSHAMVAENLQRSGIPAEAQIVVVDNFTSIEERQAITGLGARLGWTVLTPQTNLGFGGGMNLAANWAISQGAEELILLNPDAYLPGTGFSDLVAQVRRDPQLMIAPLVVQPDGSHFSSLMEIDLDTGFLRRVRPPNRYPNSASWISGACFGMNATLWQKVGGFDDDYFLYWEDVDLSLRVARAGGKLVVDETITAIHQSGGTQGHTLSPVYFRYNARNRLVFAAKHVDRAEQRQWARRMPQAAWNVLIRGGRKPLLNPIRTWLPVLRGTWEGWRYLRQNSSEKLTPNRPE